MMRTLGVGVGERTQMEKLMDIRVAAGVGC